MEKLVKFKVDGEELTFRKYKKGDEKELLPMMNKIFRENWTIEHWNWKYKKNPGGSLICVVEDKNSRIIGQFNFQKFKGIIDETISDLYISTDTFVIPSYQGKGIFSYYSQFIANYFFNKYHLSHKKAAVFGFPGDSSMNHYKKDNKNYGSAIMTKVPILNKKLFIPSITQRFIAKDKSKISFVEKNKPDDMKRSIDTLWKKQKKYISFGIVRDWSYIKWRFVDNPYKFKIYFIKLGNQEIGYFSLFFKGKICYVMDMLLLQDHINFPIAKIITKFIFSFGIKEIRLMFSDFSLNKIFIRDRFKVYSYKNLFYMGFTQDKFNTPLFLSFADLDSL